MIVAAAPAEGRGHTRRHSGAAVDTGNGWVLHCGDAYYVKRELEKAPSGVQGLRRMAHLNHGRAMGVVHEIRDAVQASNGAVTTIAAHDRYEYGDSSVAISIDQCVPSRKTSAWFEARSRRFSL